MGTDEILKQDGRGRVRVPRERQEALLEEFLKSGLSATRFARMAGIKYPTFANWLQRRRKAQRLAEETSREPSVRAGSVRLLEAVVEDSTARTASDGAGLVIELPGAARLMVHSPAQLAMAAELLGLLAHRSRGC